MRSSVLLLLAAYAAASATTLLLTLSVGNALGASALGTFAMAVAVARLFFSAGDLGLHQHLTRTIARDEARARPLSGNFAGFRIGLLLAGLAGTLLFAIVDSSSSLIYALVLIAIGCSSLQLIFDAVLLGTGHRRTSALLTGTSALLIAIGCVVWLLAEGSLVQFAATYAVCSMLGLVGWWYWVGRRVGVWVRAVLDRRQLWQEVRHSWPIGVSALLGLAALRCTVVVLGAFESDAEVGEFAAAEIFVTSAAIFQAAVSNAVYPRLSSSYRSSPADYRRLFWRALTALVVAGFAVGAVLSLAGPWLMDLVFPGKDFVRGRELLGVIGWSTPALLVAHHTVPVFAAADRQRANLLAMGSWFASIALVQVPLIALWGIEGAAWGLVLGRYLGIAVIAVIIFKLRIHRSVAG